MNKVRIRYQSIICFLFGIDVVGFFLLKQQQHCINKWKLLAGKNRGLFLLMDQWINVKQEEKKIEEYFIKNNYKRIAIYGMSCVGARLVKELRNSGIEIAYGIDRNAASIYSKIKVITMDEELPSEVDVVVVTLVDGFEEVCDTLTKKMNCPIVAIEDIINEI